MKIIVTILFLILSFNLFSQSKIVGHYRNHFGSSIQLNPDSTFKYTWHLDLSASWTKGTWSTNKDTIYFHMIPTYDTVSANNGFTNDKLILSTDEISERLTPDQYVSWGLSSGRQDILSFQKLFYKTHKMYGIKNGKLFKKKLKGFWTKKKWRPWYFKSET